MAKNNSPSARRARERWLKGHLERAASNENFGRYVSVEEWCAKHGWPNIVKLQKMLSKTAGFIHAAFCQPFYKKPHQKFMAVNAYDPRHIKQAADLIRDNKYVAKTLKWHESKKKQKGDGFFEVQHRGSMKRLAHKDGDK